MTPHLTLATLELRLQLTKRGKMLGRGTVRRSAQALFVLVLAFVGMPRAIAADPATAAVAIAAAEAAKNALNDVAAHLGGEAIGVVGFTSQQLTQQIQDLQSLAKNQLQVPLAQLGIDAQNLARSLNATVERINDLLTKQRQCLMQDSFVFLAALRSLAQGVKSGIPLVGSGGPRVDYFRFATHAAGVVPLSGGRVVIAGYKLWDAPPVLELLNESRDEKVVPVVAQRGSNDDELSFMISAEALATRGGECLQIHVQPRKRTRFLFIPAGSKSLGDVYLPMCVPDSKPFRLRADFTHAYRCSQYVERALDWRGGKPYYAEAHTCNQRDNVHGTQTWPVPANCRIVRVDVRREGITRNEDCSTRETHTRDSVTLDSCISPTCVCAPIVGCHKNYHGVWSYSAQPVIGCDEETPLQATASTPVLTLAAPGTPVTSCIDLPKSCQFPVSDFELAVMRVFEDGLAPVELLRQPRVSVAHALAPQTQSAGSITFTTSYNPGAAAAQAQACITATAQACNY